MTSTRTATRVPTRGPRRRAALRAQIGTDETTAADILTTARAQRQAVLDAQTGMLISASRWAAAHTVDPDTAPDDADVLPGREGAVQVAGDGAPWVAEFCLAELAAVLGMSTTAGRSLVGDAVELVHRLPMTWNRLLTGQVSCWRARRIAAATAHLPLDAAAHVDEDVHGRAETISLTGLDHLVTEALTRFDPAAAAEVAALAAEHRHVTITDPDTHLNRTDGLAELTGVLDTADARDFGALVADVAHQLLALHPDAPLDVRRALALGYIGRGQPVPATSAPTDDVQPSRPRQVVLYLHLAETAVRGAGGLALLEEGRLLVDADRVRDWLDTPHATVVVKPVIDLADHHSTDAYEVPDRLREQAVLRDRTCVFPWCGTSARRGDIDHVVPHEHGGETATDNLAPLCRRHHRLKTHSAWTYTVLRPGSYRWTSPHGHHFHRDHTGTRPLE